ncbi:transposase [Bernardetia litoralis DSM 6794]|uniref:Transposase n=1 Tax=Bernardetia litoralis (strain ATCC 23117 / DSM 6794 / NBRC 15988 / NCIMB 1366 / Fx l1 / Sio-4) TaxID=880071 RepID=I4AMQ7_BERLS|nr:transposase [Bernardetia litoralis]AFM05242.1 transposase [Bernardetia litoralis DSM 6794]
MAKFKGKYRSESHRLKGWDYSSEAVYFITFCVQDFECLFGSVINIVDKHSHAKNIEINNNEIHNNESVRMDLNQFGQIVEEEIQKSIEIRKNWIFHEWVVMPNHVHMLIEIELNDNNSVQTHRSASQDDKKNQDNAIHGNTIHNSESLQLHRQPNSISSFIGIFKTVVTKKINELRNAKGERIWQRNYHDHIVRNYQSFQNIANYIDQNPQRWYEDRFNPNSTKK